MSLRCAFRTFDMKNFINNHKIHMQVQLVVAFVLGLLSNTIGGNIVPYTSSIHCFPQEEILQCDLYNDSSYSSFTMCPENTYWTQQFMTANYSITGKLVCNKCQSGTSNSKAYNWDTECQKSFLSVLPASPLEHCFIQLEYLRCETDSGNQIDYLICKENHKWTGNKIKEQNSHGHLECVSCPSDMYIPYKYHCNTTCIRKESSHPTNAANSIPTIECNFWTISILIGLVLLCLF